MQTYVGNYELQNCIYNASGPRCTTDTELLDLLCSESGAVVTKSCTLNSRDGNPEPRYCNIPGGSINSNGLCNRGFDYYLDFIRDHKEEISKPFFLSISGMTWAENSEMFTYLEDDQPEELAMPEFNMSCPNIVGKSQIAYDFPATEETLRKVCDIYTGQFGIKLPPYFDLVHFGAMADILGDFPQVSFLTCVNSIGNGLWIDVDSESTVIKPKKGFGGIGGVYIKPTALANVRKFYELLGGKKDIIGCGGVQTGRDVFEHLLAGASAVQVGTQFYTEGVDCFTRLSSELKELMDSKGYTNVSEFQGKLRAI